MPALIKPILTGFFVEAAASFDDTLTRIPLVAELTRRRIGKVAFSIGSLLALTVILLISIRLSAFLNSLPYPRFIIAGLILLIAVAVYFGIFFSKREQEVEQRYKSKDFTRERFIKLIAIGFLISIISLIDDAVVLTSLFIGDGLNKLLTITGVYLATLVQITLIIYFGERLNKFKYKKEAASLALVVLAILILTGII